MIYFDYASCQPGDQLSKKNMDLSKACVGLERMFLSGFPDFIGGIISALFCVI